MAKDGADEKRDPEAGHCIRMKHGPPPPMLCSSAQQEMPRTVNSRPDGAEQRGEGGSHGSGPKVRKTDRQGCWYQAFKTQREGGK